MDPPVNLMMCALLTSQSKMASHPILGAPKCNGDKTTVSGHLLDDPGESGFQSAGEKCFEARALH